MSTLKVTNLQHPSAASANVTLDASGNADFNGKNLAGVASVNGSQLGGFKNRIINGNFSIAQRGTSQTSAQYGSLDRWYFNTSGGTGTLSQETNANPSETDGLQKYARLNITSSSDFTAMLQRIEDVTSIPSGTVVLSFWAKGTAPTGGLMVWCTQVFGSGGSADVDIAEQVIASSLTSTWTRYTLSITVPSIDGKTIGTGSYFMVTIGQGSDSSSTAYDLNISGVQLEISSDGTATDFEHESVGTTYQKCLRYFEQPAYESIVAVRATSASTGDVSAFAPWTVQKRATPSITFESGASNLGFTNAQLNGTRFLQTPGVAAGTVTNLSFVINVDAEL